MQEEPAWVPGWAHKPGVLRPRGAGDPRLGSDSTWTQASSHPSGTERDSSLRLRLAPAWCPHKACLTLSVKHLSKLTGSALRSQAGTQARTSVGEWGLAGRLQSGSDRCPARPGLRRSVHPRNSVLGGSLPSARCLVALQEPGSPIRFFFNPECVNNVLISPERSTAVSSLGGRRKTKRLLSAFDRGEFFCPAAFL